MSFLKKTQTRIREMFFGSAKKKGVFLNLFIFTFICMIWVFCIIIYLIGILIYLSFLFIIGFINFFCFLARVTKRS